MDSEDWQTLQWEIPIDMPPEIVQIGTSAHGHVPIERYTMIGLWCLHLYRYDAVVRVGGRDLPIRPGHAGIMPPDTPMEYRYNGRSPHLYVHFRCSELPKSPRSSIPAMLDLGDSFGRIYEQMLEVVDRTDRFTAARLWDVLWQLSDRRPPDGFPQQGVHSAVQRTVKEIDRQLSGPIRVAALATAAGVSTSHLSRLFQEAFGQTVIGYIGRRRIARATHLLTQSTLPIKTIAVMVGLPDLQHFNRAMHKTLGKSPRQVRIDRTDLPEH